MEKNRPGGGIMHIDLAKLIKAMDGRDMTFFCKHNGEPLSDKEARTTLGAYIKDGYTRIPMRQDDTINIDPDKDTSKLGRLRKAVADCEREIMDSRRKTGRIIPPAKLMLKLETLKEQLKEAEAYAPQELGKILPREKIAKLGLGKKMVKVHIASDYLTETASVMRSAFDKAGLQFCNLYPIIGAIEKKASEFTAIVCHPEFAGLSDFMTTNEPLIRDLDTICDRYLNENFTIDDAI